MCFPRKKNREFFFQIFYFQILLWSEISAFEAKHQSSTNRLCKEKYCECVCVPFPRKKDQIIIN